MINWKYLLLPYEDYEGSFNEFLEDVYKIYNHDFIKNKPKYLGNSVNIKKYPIFGNKEYNYWHIISEGKIEEERYPDIARCERIKWPAKVIENSTDSSVLVWKNKRGNNIRILIYLSIEDYLVVLEERSDYILFITAYPVVENHRKRALHKEYEKYKKQEPHAK
jgi:hypothetical protein